MNNRLFDNAKIVPAFVPIDTTGAGQDGDWVSLKNYNHLTVIIMKGAWAGGTSAVTLQQATDVAGTGAKALGFTKQWVGTALTDDNLAETAVTSNTFNLSTTANEFHVIEIDAATLDVDGGFDCVRVRTATPGANADLVAGLYVLTGCRYSQADTPSAIVD